MKSEIEDSATETPPVSYATRNNAFMPPCLWVLDGPVLREETEGGAVHAWPLADVVSVNLQFMPTRPEQNRYRCRLHLRNGRVREFFNRTYLGPYQFRATNEAYVVFVDALHRALAVHAPGCCFTAGTTRAGYAVNVFAAIFLGAVLAAVAVFFMTVGLVPIAVIKVIFILFYLPTLLRWFRRNRPVDYEARAIPSFVLPKTEPPPLPA